MQLFAAIIYLQFLNTVRGASSAVAICCHVEFLMLVIFTRALCGLAPVISFSVDGHAAKGFQHGFIADSRA